MIDLRRIFTMENVFDMLEQRGLIKQSIYTDELKDLLGKQKVVCYMGFDPTAPSLHVGSLAAILFLRRMQMYGHTPIALVGGATGAIGDPSFRNSMRPMMTDEQRHKNVESIKAQLESFFDQTGPNKLIVVNNEDWIKNLSWMDMLREIGTNMSVNRMLANECFKTRFESDNGLSFLEFNYMPMQAYDFLHLFRTYNCQLELGGSDQWGNIVAGVDLIRRKTGKPAFAMTLPLLTKSDGTKMGKSVGGAVWLNRDMYSDYDFYQYFRDIEDVKVKEIFKMLTFLPLDEIDRICDVKGKDMNIAKERLAYEVTKIVRGEESAKRALDTAHAVFEANDANNMPTITITKNDAKDILSVLIATKLAGTRGEARRLVEGKGVRINDETIESYDYTPTKTDFILRKGKKTVLHVLVK